MGARRTVEVQAFQEPNISETTNVHFSEIEKRLGQDTTLATVAEMLAFPERYKNEKNGRWWVAADELTNQMVREGPGYYQIRRRKGADSAVRVSISKLTDAQAANGLSPSQKLYVFRSSLEIKAEGEPIAFIASFGRHGSKFMIANGKVIDVARVPSVSTKHAKVQDGKTSMAEIREDLGSVLRSRGGTAKKLKEA